MYLTYEVQRVITEIPGGRSDANRTRSTQPLDHVDTPHEQVAFDVGPERRVPLVDPPMQRNLMSRGDAGPDLARMKQRRDSRHEKRRGDPMVAEQPQDARHRDPGAVF